jgi:phage-related protein
MPSVAQGVFELRVHSENAQFRAMYYLATEKGILVFHAFVMKTEQAPNSELALAESASRRCWIDQTEHHHSK